MAWYSVGTPPTPYDTRKPKGWVTPVAPVDPYWSPSPTPGTPIPEPVGSTGWTSPNAPADPYAAPPAPMAPRPAPIEPQAPTTIGGRWGGAWDWDGQHPQQQPGRVGGTPNMYGQRGGGASAFQGADEFSRLAWQSDPQTAYRHFVAQEAAPGSHLERWLLSQQNAVLDNFVNASRAQKDLYIGDYLPQARADLVNRYAGMPSWQQGTNGPGPWFSGRRMG